MGYTIALIRHGESVWNVANIFTGWTDVDLTEVGIREATLGGRLLRTQGFEFDLAYTSVLRRAIKTCNTVLDQLDQLWIPVTKEWRLNERHYGDLQGKNKKETAQKYGDEQVHIWRRSYDTPPATMTADDPRSARQDRRYSDLSPDQVPLTESLKETVARFLPYWKETIAPVVKSGKRVLIAAHGNSLRALVKYLDNISDAEIPGLEIPTGVPLIYELDDDLKPIKHYYIGEKAAVEKKLGFLGSSPEAERLAKAFTSAKLFKLKDLSYLADTNSEAFQKLGIESAHDSDAIAAAADVLFVFGSADELSSKLKDLSSQLKGDKIIVPVISSGTFSAKGANNKIVVAAPKDSLKPGGKVNDLGTPVSLKQAGSASEKDVAIVKTLFEAAGFPVSS
ncbi:hypothetical protein WJX84_008498 [Apatococcus fuscideae]|uniref:Phosphoglycerate mutase n=1 Tax=Apatococcus fuscideae TaxID=2026836 RepID=A0AAW1SV03_9CHLO